MSERGPRVSIIVPSYNQGRFIGETILSCLGQTYPNIEVIVQDGASSDETLGVLTQFDDPRLSCVSEPDRGVVDAVNRALARATGEILAIQSSDDLYLPDAVAQAVESFRAHDSAGLVYGNVDLIDEASRVIGKDLQNSEFSLAAYLGRLIYVPQPAAFFHRRCLARVPGWRAEVSYVADADFWIRMAMHFPVLHVPHVLGRYRYHADQRDTQKQRIMRDWINCIDGLLAEGGLSMRERRYARMGKALARHRYTAEDRWVERTIALYQAHAYVPEALFDPRVAKRQLFPGRDPIWRVLSRVKRSVLGEVADGSHG